MKRASGSTCSRSPGMQKKRQSSSKPVGRALELRGHLRQPAQRQEVGEGAVGPLDRQLQHLAPQRREHDRDPLRRRRFQLEAGRGALAGQRGVEEVERLPHLAQRLLEGDAVPAFDDAVRGGADPEHEAPAGGAASAAASCASSAGPRWKTPTIPVPEPHPLGPGGAQRQRREAVGPGGLAASRGRCSRPPRRACTCSSWSASEMPGSGRVSPQR